MKPARFTYLAPTSPAEAVAALAEAGDGAKVLAGGQSLVPLMNMRLVRPDVLVDINGVRDWDYVRDTPDGGLAIGATTRQREMQFSPLIRQRAPLLVDAARLIGHFQIRNRGTICGSVAHADPAAELPAVMAVLEAAFTIVGPSGTHTDHPANFFVSYLTTSLAPDEILAEVQVPALPPGAGWGVHEVSRRHGDFALVGAAVILTPDPGPDGSGRIGGARMALFGVGPTPARNPQAEAALVGEAPSDALFANAAALATANLETESDVHASAEYRAEVAIVVLRRALRDAAARMAERANDNGRTPPA